MSSASSSDFSCPVMSNAIGIDLGTSKCCVSVFWNGKVVIIPNEFENDTTPSFIAFAPIFTIGEAAKNKLRRSPSNTIYAALRLIGRKFEDPVVQSDMKYWPFKVVSDEKGRPMVEVGSLLYGQKCYPEEVVAMLLGDLKHSAEIYLESPVKDVVITVPADFNHCYHHAIRDAARIAGLNVLRVVNAPTAAAIEHIVAMKDSYEHNHLVFDFGAGTLDVSVISGDDSAWIVKSTVSEHHFGGEDVTSRLFDYFKAEFERKFCFDATLAETLYVRLRAACERVKIDLSKNTEAVIELQALFHAIDFKATITRAFFEGLCYDLFQRIWGCLEKALDDACVEKYWVDDIILLGGSSHIPVVQKMLSEYFVNAQLIKTLNTAEAAASGAAIQAALLSGDVSEDIQNLLIPHATPLTLGIDENGEMDVFIDHRTAIPVQNSKVITAKYDDNNEIVIKAFEGDDDTSEYNTLLGEIKLNKFPRQPNDNSNGTKVEVTFQVDVTGAITISATDKSTGKTEILSFPDKNNCFSEEELEDMTKSMEKVMRNEKSRRQGKSAKGRLIAYCNSMIETVEKNRRKRKALDPEDQQVYKKCKDALVWIDRNPRAEADDVQRQLQEVSEWF